MLKKIVLPVVLLILSYGFWVSPDFKEIAAGVSIFLFGMLFLEDGFREFTGGVLEKILRRTTDKLWKSVSFGVLSTTFMQSSSLVSVITISFLSAGLIGLSAGIGIIFGANLGTTTGAWLIAGFGLKVKISAYAMPMLVFGLILTFQKAKSLKGIGYILAGMGFLFLGIHYMKEGFESFKDTIDLAQFAVAGYPGLFLFAGIGVFATVVMQSSHATLVIIITALAAGQITYENALALAIGANVGTTITAILGSLGSNVDGRRLAGAHLIFNMVTGVVAIVFIYQIQEAVVWVSDAVGISADDYTLKLAIFHTIFNLLGVIIMLPFVNRLVIFLNKNFVNKEPGLIEPLYLNDAAIEFPDTAIETVRKETLHLFDQAFEVIAHGIGLHRHELLSEKRLDEVVRQRGKPIHIDIDDVYANKIKVIYSAIVEFIGRAQHNMPAEYAEQLFALRASARDIVEAVKDVKHLRKNLITYVHSDNAHIRGEYNKIQEKIGGVLQEIHALSTTVEEVDLLSLDALRIEIEESDILTSGDLDRLIRERKITAQMATSLINDVNYSHNIVNNLITMGPNLFITHDPVRYSVERNMALDSEDIEGLVSSKI
ncbi:MAG: Na/Pi cotransporter family protein [Gammaproteobacteria bacterium]|jgi:phosphate:Na+ symporter|nr:Na/Pi cotransporter family protein [Gammaproteobacteria bacterium]MBT7307737.1 Na/Pi cotransporter family protein [Gammaproteobacteria bacterium]